MDYIGPILAFLTAAAGWYYLFYSRAAENLAGLEAERLNRKRARLRRIGGAVMLLLGVGLYLGFRAADSDNRPVAFVVIWLIDLALMAVLVVLALFDVRLTARLRKTLRARGSADAPTTAHDPAEPPQPRP